MADPETADAEAADAEAADAEAADAEAADAEAADAEAADAEKGEAGNGATDKADAEKGAFDKDGAEKDDGEKGDAGSDAAGSDDVGDAGSDGPGHGDPDPGGDASGAVGVGTGGSAQRQSDSVGRTVRTGPATDETGGGAGVPVTGGAVGGPVGTVVAGVAGVAGVVVTGAGVACRGCFGPEPSPVFGLAVAMGNVSATAGWASSEVSPFTTPRYAPAAPATASTTRAVIAVARRGGRGTGGGTQRASAGSRQPKVFMPVEVMSGPPVYDPDRRSARVVRNSLIGWVLRSHRTGVLPVRRCSGTL